jgi:hypothetical protein
MVSRRRYRSSPGSKLAGILFLSLAALALASSAYLDSPRVPVRMTHKAVLSGIAPIYRQISAQAAQAAPVPGGVSPATTHDTFGAAFLRLDGYAEEADATAPGEMDPQVSGTPARGVTVSLLGGRWLSPGGARRPAMPEDLSGAAALVFNGSFSSLFSRIFDPQADESSRNAELSAETRNPFSEAKQKEDAARHAAADPAQTSRDKAATDAHAAESASPAQEAMTASGPAAKPERYAFLGDFDGSGALSILTAERSGELAYVFADGSRTFSLFINPSAVESQRSLALDDVNGDGIMDLLVTARASLFGGVLIGNGKGDYAPAATFLTGYEPVLAAVGPCAEGGREIITVNTRSGAVTRFIPKGTYQRRSAGKLDFLPDYINHVVEQEHGADYLQMARLGGEPKLYEWPVDGRMERRMLALTAESDLQAGPDPALGSRIGSIRIYQAGAYASVVLANTAGQTFNVANLKVSPQACLVFGDLEGKGNLDVGVAHMVSFTPSK